MKNLISISVMCFFITSCGGYFVPENNQMYKNSKMPRINKNTTSITFTQGGYHKAFIEICDTTDGTYKYLNKKVF